MLVLVDILLVDSFVPFCSRLFCPHQVGVLADLQHYSYVGSREMQLSACAFYPKL